MYVYINQFPKMKLWKAWNSYSSFSGCVIALNVARVVSFYVFFFFKQILNNQTSRNYISEYMWKGLFKYLNENTSIFWLKIWPTLWGRQVVSWWMILPATHTDVVQQLIPLPNPQARQLSEFCAQAKQEYKTPAASQKNLTLWYGRND